jgi:hypothetical protein
VQLAQVHETSYKITHPNNILIEVGLTLEFLPNPIVTKSFEKLLLI